MAQVIGIGADARLDQTVYDPTCGSGSLLIKAADAAPNGLTIYGQEKDAAHDEYRRFDHGEPPAKNGDYAYLLHLVASLRSTGKGAIVMPHGVLFRGNREAAIRRNLVKRGWIKGVIGLPANLFYGTGIPACIVVIDKEDAVARRGIFMIDASKGFRKDGAKNRLRERDIHRIVDVFTEQREVPGCSRMVPLTEIASEANDYNLNIPRYIDSSEPEDLHDLAAHLHGGIPNRDIDALGDYWEVFPGLRKHAPRLRELAVADSPKDLIRDLSEDLLHRFAGLPLLDRYGVYQCLMDYWDEVMQDDVYLVVTEGWTEAARPRGFSVRYLRQFRRFYLDFRETLPRLDKRRTVFSVSAEEIRQTPFSEFLASKGGQSQASVSALLLHRFPLGWSHYVTLLSVTDPEARRFYEIEAAENGWSVRQLKHQLDSSLYQRLALSRDKHEVLVCLCHNLLKMFRNRPEEAPAAPPRSAVAPPAREEGGGASALRLGVLLFCLSRPTGILVQSSHTRTYTETGQDPRIPARRRP